MHPKDNYFDSDDCMVDHFPTPKKSLATKNYHDSKEAIWNTSIPLHVFSSLSPSSLNGRPVHHPALPSSSCIWEQIPIGYSDSYSPHNTSSRQQPLAATAGRSTSRRGKRAALGEITNNCPVFGNSNNIRNGNRRTRVVSETDEAW